MHTPVEIAYRRCQASDRVREEIDAQTQRLEKLGRNVTGCHVVVTGPGQGRAGEGYRVRLRLDLPERKEVIVERTDADPGHHDALAAVREAFDVARRRLDDAERELRGDVKTHARAGRERLAERLAGEG